jgi:hypothetical protein
MTGTASAKTPVRIPLPGGGSILAPRNYATDAQRSFRQKSIALYRRLHNTLGGYEECDGLINIARRDQFPDLDIFAIEVEKAATTSWEYGNLKPGWTSFESERFPVGHADGPSGRERSQQLSIKTPGIFKERINVGWRIAIDHKTGLLMQVWLFEKQGGLTGARKLADEIAASYAT